MSILPLDLSGVELVRGGRRILGPIDLTLGEGGITMVLGPNGSGKTSLLRTMHGLERSRVGTLRWACSGDEARRHQSFVFQSPILLRRSVVECIAYPLRLDGVPKTEAREQAAEAARGIGLGNRLDDPASVLSGGERQKLALVRALIRAPQLLFLDEPCANLDGHSTIEIEARLIAAREAGTRIVMSTHNVAQAQRLADDVLFIYRGLIHDRGLAASFFASPATVEAAAYIRGDLLP